MCDCKDIEKNEERLGVLLKEYCKSIEGSDYIPFDLFGIECNKGWYGLIIPIVEYINDFNSKMESPDKYIKITQIKEKYGSLRFYTSFGTKELYEMIDKAEDDSYNICETCGSSEHVGHTLRGWEITCCKNCLEKLNINKDNWSEND